ncbi:hypothetical protein EDC04DRAFT_74195 [Pisolithus marmoratus]|nr:hypothetical protein EDC04DRAFT_74195 [Pisolithus marmoratus]
MSEKYPLTLCPALALWRFISRCKPRFIFPIHRVNYDPNRLRQHRITSTVKALARLLNMYILPAIIIKIKLLYNQIPGRTISCIQLAKHQKPYFIHAHFALIKADASSLVFHLICASARPRSLPDGGFATRLEHERRRALYPCMCFDFLHQKFPRNHRMDLYCTTRSLHCFHKRMY